jgi:hypothetical protein
MPSKLRIAVSGFFGVLTLLLVVLWVRSYWVSDVVNSPVPGNTSFLVRSQNGCLTVLMLKQRMHPNWPRGFIWEEHPASVDRQRRVTPASWGYYPNPGSGDWTVVIPQWFPAALMATICIAPWATLRFSLRTLLIATTLLAVVLGLAVWAGR